MTLTEKKEKKVEYIELIFDLIFVYVIGRNNQILHHTTGGFVDANAFVMYVVCTVAVIQLWMLTAYYINVFGRQSVRDHVMLFITMFLMYFIGEATTHEWQTFHTQYHAAWALILLNIAVQYLIELRHHEKGSAYRRRVLCMFGVIVGEMLLVVGAIIEFRTAGSSYLSAVALAASITAVGILGHGGSTDLVDFPHLSERAMLYVVFTFGEMIIALAAYFEGGFSLSSLYVSAMSFLVVVGLFLSYGVLYDHIIDREKKTNGLGYMLIHIFLIFSLNNITIALEFMRDEHVDLLQKMVLLMVSFLLYFAFLFATVGYAKTICYAKGRVLARVGLMGAVFAVLMIVTRANVYWSVTISVAFVFAVFWVLYSYGKRVDCPLPARKT